MGRKESPGHGNDKSRVSFRAEEEFIALLEDVQEERGYSSRSDAIRAACEDWLDEAADETETVLPANTLQRKGLEAIVKYCYQWENGFIVDYTEAIGDIKNATNLGERAVKRRVMVPLQDNGLITNAGPGKFEVATKAVTELRAIHGSGEVAQA